MTPASQDQNTTKIGDSLNIPDLENGRVNEGTSIRRLRYVNQAKLGPNKTVKPH
jgi:hypothetical protein